MLHPRDGPLDVGVDVRVKHVEIERIDVGAVGGDQGVGLLLLFAIRGEQELDEFEVEVVLQGAVLVSLDELAGGEGLVVGEETVPDEVQDLGDDALGDRVRDEGVEEGGDHVEELLKGEAGHGGDADGGLNGLVLLVVFLDGHRVPELEEREGRIREFVNSFVKLNSPEIPSAACDSLRSLQGRATS